MKRLFLSLILLLPAFLMAAETDSTRVEQLLRKGQAQPAGTNLMVFYGKQLMNIPYVAKTLEVNATEQLAVNLTSLDCTTLVENVVALSLTTKAGSTRFADFKQHLLRIRYRNGVLDGYASRNHYFSEWIISNEGLGIVQEVKGKVKDSRGSYYPFVEPQTLKCTYMSEHPESYPMLRKDPDALQLIKENERRINGRKVRYIPKRLVGATRKELSSIHDGDILAIVTSKKGLDISHVGIAVWEKDGRLHLLNASQIHKKVVLEPMTLYQYMQKHSSQLGVRVVRVNIKNEKLKMKNER